jgi:DNA-binding beta-propeller fold protein YncE
MRKCSVTAMLVVATAAAGCGGEGATPPAHAKPRRAVHPAHAVASSTPPVRLRRHRHARPRPIALVAAESEDHVVSLELPSARVMRRLSVPAGPQYVASENGVTVTTSPPAGAVTVIDGDQHREVLHGFGAPHLVTIAPDRKYAYVTDDARGTLDVIRLSRTRVTSTTKVGLGAHHMASSPNERRLWIALGESAHTIVIVNTTDIDHPRVVGSFDPGFLAHDLTFSPNGRQVWITSASGNEVSVFDAVSHRLLFRVPVGPPPQHVAFGGGFALLTSGYGSTIAKVNPATGRVVAHAHTPYGSFELDAAHGYVVTASLLNGEVAVFTPGLKLLHVRKVAAATRDLTIAMR